MLSYVSTESSDHSRLYCLARHTSQTSTLKTNTSHYQLQPQDQHFIPSSADLRPTRHTITTAPRPTRHTVNYSPKTNTSHRLLQPPPSTTASRPTRHTVYYSPKTNTSHRHHSSADLRPTLHTITTASRPTRHTISYSLQTNTSHRHEFHSCLPVCCRSHHQPCRSPWQPEDSRVEWTHRTSSEPLLPPLTTSLTTSSSTANKGWSPMINNCTFFN